jgi:hypothetical protein
MTNETAAGKLTIWLTEGAVQRAVLGVCAGLTAGGERLLVLDAAGCLEPSRLSRAEASTARSIQVMHLPLEAPMDEPAALSARIDAARREGPVRRVLMVGLLDHLQARQVLTRDTARALGRIKHFVEKLAASGMEVTLLCQAAAGLGTRMYLISSLCAAADEVHRPRSDAQQDVDRASAAIA